MVKNYFKINPKSSSSILGTPKGYGSNITWEEVMRFNIITIICLILFELFIVVGTGLFSFNFLNIIADTEFKLTEQMFSVGIGLMLLWFALWRFTILVKLLQVFSRRFTHGR